MTDHNIDIRNNVDMDMDDGGVSDPRAKKKQKPAPPKKKVPQKRTAQKNNKGKKRKAKPKPKKNTKKKRKTKPKQTPLQSLQVDVRTKALFDQQDKTLFLPLAFFEQRSKNVGQGQEGQGAQSTSLTTEQQNQQKVIQGLANSVVLQDLKDILDSSSKRDYLEKSKVLSCHLSLDSVKEITMEGYEREIYRFIYWIGLNRKALMEMMCGTWSGLLRDIQPLHFQLYILVRAGLDLNVEHRTGQHEVPLSNHPSVEKRYTDFNNVAESLCRYKRDTRTQLQTSALIDVGTFSVEDIDTLEDNHAQMCKLLSSISTISEKFGASSTIANTTPAPTQQQAQFIAKGSKLLESLSELYENKINTHLEDVTFAMMFATGKTLSDNAPSDNAPSDNAPSDNAPSSNATSGHPPSVRADLYRTVRDAFEGAKSNGLEDDIKSNLAKVQGSITSGEAKLYKWLKDVLSTFEQPALSSGMEAQPALSSGMEAQPALSRGMEAHLQNIRVILSERFLANEYEGRKWEPPPNRRHAEGAPFVGLKSLKKVHSALLILLKQNPTFFADPDLKAKANTLRILKQHMKLSEANDRGPTQRTALNQARMDAYMAHLKDKFDCQHAKVKEALHALSKAQPSDSAKRALDSKYMEELSMLMVLSSRITLLHKGAHCGERFGQSKKAKLKVTQGPNQEQTAQSFSKASDTKTQTEDMTLTIPHHKDCSHARGESVVAAASSTSSHSNYGLPTLRSTTCTSCVLIRHVKLQEFVNKQLMARSLPTIGLHPGCRNNSKSIGGKVDVVRKLKQISVSRHERGCTPSPDGGGTFINCRGAIDAKQLVIEKDGLAIVQNVPLCGPLTKLKRGDIIGAVRKGSSNTLTEAEKQNLGKDDTLEAYSTVVQALSTPLGDGSHVYLYVLHAQKQRRDIDGGTFCKWLKKTIREWQHSFKDKSTANPLFMSETAIKNIGTHSPRVSLAANAFDLGCDIIGIMKALDHKRITMTLHYIKQALRSRAAKANTIQTMASGQRVDTGTAAPRRIDAVGTSMCPSGLSPGTWEKLQMDRTRYQAQGYLRFQCTHCCAPYDEQRHIGFSGKQALENHVERCQKIPKNEKDQAVQHAKASRTNLEKAGINLEALLGKVSDATENCTRQVQMRQQKKVQKNAKKKKRKRY